MSKRERDKKISELYNEEGLTYAEVGRRYGLSLERIRQIVNPEKGKYCEEHSRRYSGKECPICKVKRTYWNYIDDKESLEREIEKLPRDRKQVTVLKRMLVAKKLKEQGTKISLISRLLNYHPSTINYLLNVKEKK